MPDAGAADVTRAAGRGGLAVAFAKIYFILVGLVQQIALPRLLGLDGYGALASVLSIAGITYNPVTTTSIQSVTSPFIQVTAAQNGTNVTINPTVAIVGGNSTATSAAS